MGNDSDILLLRALEVERENLIKRLTLIDAVLIEYELSESAGNNSVTLFTENIFKHNVNSLYEREIRTKTKVIAILKSYKRFMHVRELARVANRIETNFSEDQIVKKISPVLSTLYKNGEANLVKICLKNKPYYTVWGFGNWLDENGNILEEYIYKTIF